MGGVLWPLRAALTPEKTNSAFSTAIYIAKGGKKPTQPNRHRVDMVSDRQASSIARPGASLHIEKKGYRYGFLEGEGAG